jgi:hypothetical protein
MTNATSKQAAQIIRYTSEIESRLRNVDALPRGLRCPYLVVIRGEGNDLIAKQWTRVKPTEGVAISFSRQSRSHSTHAVPY